MPTTAFAHFQEDIARARAILAHADPLPTDTAATDLLRSDLLRSSWMFAVGAFDAYFCDAYSDVVAATLCSKSHQPTVALPDFFTKIMLPVHAVLADYAHRVNWRWRMAARRMMEQENILKLDTIQALFKHFFPAHRRFFKPDVLDAWIVHASADKRMFGIWGSDFTALNDAGKNGARTRALDKMEGRLSDIIQRRHDCIHNCDRPRMAPQPLSTSSTVTKVIQDIEFFVTRCNEHIDAEFPLFLGRIGCSPATITYVGY